MLKKILNEVISNPNDIYTFVKGLAKCSFLQRNKNPEIEKAFNKFVHTPTIQNFDYFLDEVNQAGYESGCNAEADSF